MDDSKKEWDESEEVDLPQQTWDAVWKSIKRKRPSSRLVTIKKIAVAASVLIIVAASVKLFDKEEVMKAAAVVKSETAVDGPQQKLLVNTTRKTITAYLPDSSAVLLSPAAIVKYSVPFTNNRRDFFLEGEARFKVKHDKAMPFTVFAGELATTALGTEFTINTSVKNATVVKLHSGKVVVRANKHVYLTAGQQLTFNTATMTASVGRIKNTRAVASAKSSAVNREDGNEMIFVNTPLSEVISKLERHYRSNIQYNHNEIATINFTGTVSKDDSLHIVLKVIAQMNSLEMVHENEKYELRKIK